MAKILTAVTNEILLMFKFSLQHINHTLTLSCDGQYLSCLATISRQYTISNAWAYVEKIVKFIRVAYIKRFKYI